jgi:hypothetical protein
MVFMNVTSVKSDVYWALITCNSECPTFQRNVSPTSSGSKNNPSKKLAETGCKLSSAGFLIGLLFDHEDRGIVFLHNGEMTPNYAAYNTEAP